MRRFLLIFGLVVFSACQPTAPPASAPPAMVKTPQGAITEPKSPELLPAQQDEQPAVVPLVPDAGVASTTAEALNLLPASCTSVLVKDHKALTEFGLRFLIDPAGKGSGEFDDYFSHREVELSAVARFGSELDEPGTLLLRLAPGVTVQRMVNDLKLRQDDSAYPGFVCYRPQPGSDNNGVIIALRNGLAAIGSEHSLKPRLTGKPKPGPLELRLSPLASDHELLLGWLPEYQSIAFAAEYLRPIESVVSIIQHEMRAFPPGGINSVVIGLRTRQQPRVTVRIDAADRSVASDLEAMAERTIKRVQNDYVAARPALRSKLPADISEDIDRFLSTALAEIRLRRSDAQLEVTVPLGNDATELKWFAELVSRQDVQFERHLNDALAESEKAARQHDPTFQLQQIGIAFHNYHDVHLQFPPNISAEGKPLLSWRVAILPLLESGDLSELYSQFKLDEPWDSENNRPLLDKLPEIYRDLRVTDPTRTTLQVFAGKGTAFEGVPSRWSDIYDGTTNTLMVIQSTPERAVPWTKPEDLPFDPANPASALGSIPKDGILAVMFDSVVRRFPPEFPNDMWRRVIQPRDGEVVELPKR